MRLYEVIFFEPSINRRPRVMCCLNQFTLSASLNHSLYPFSDGDLGKYILAQCRLVSTKSGIMLTQIRDHYSNGYAWAFHV